VNAALEPVERILREKRVAHAHVDPRRHRGERLLGQQGVQTDFHRGRDRGQVVMPRLAPVGHGRQERHEAIGRHAADGQERAVRQLTARHRLHDRRQLGHRAVEDLPTVERLDQIDVRGLDVDHAQLRRASSIVRKSSNSTGYAGNRVARS
jgi:hypothetical protein